MENPREALFGTTSSSSIEKWVLVAFCWPVFVVYEDTGQPEVAQ